VPVPGAGAYTWAYQVPCKTSVGGRTYSLDTSALADGTHHVQVIIEDAAGDQSVVLDRVVASRNTPAPVGGSAAASGPASPPFASTPNGAGASASADLRLAGRTTITRVFAHRALTIAGALLDRSGGPIAGASLDVREQAAGESQAKLIAHTSTHADGSFSVNVAPGPSRRILLDYRAFSADSAYSAEASVDETVFADVQIHVTPRRTSPAGTIAITGQVAGPIPRRGVLVELLVHYRGAWEPFRDPRSDSRGRFRLSYRFQGAVGSFPFRAEVSGGQSEFPYATGVSAPVRVQAR